eukprot:350266-Chlamydomonas_euryale.AAC.1
MALFHQQRGVAVALGRKVAVGWCGTGVHGRKVNIFALNMPWSVYGHGRLFVRRTNRSKLCCLPAVKRRHRWTPTWPAQTPVRAYRLPLGTCWALVGRLALASGRNAAAVPEMPACMPAARGRKRRHTVAALRARGRRPPPLPPLSMARLARYARGSSGLRFVHPVE